MISFQTDVQIRGPVEDVFSYVADPLNLPRWNSAVETVRKTSPAENGAATTYLMERKLPSGAAVNKLEVVASKPPTELAIRASEGPTPFLYRYRLSAEHGQTVVTLNAEIELGAGTALLPQLARRAIKNGVDHNLTTLKQIIEAAQR